MHSRNKCNFSRKVYFSNNCALSAFHSSLVSIPWSQGKLTSLETERNSDIKYSYKHEHYKNYKLFTLFLEETRNLFKRWPLNLWWISNKTIIEVGNIIYKSCYFQKFSSQKLLKHSYFFCDSTFYFFHEANISRSFSEVAQKYELRLSFKVCVVTQGSLTFLV